MKTKEHNRHKNQKQIASFNYCYFFKVTKQAELLRQFNINIQSNLN